MPTEHFKSKESYRRWNAYRHLHGIPAPHLKTAVVGGKAHKVKHSKLSERKLGKSRPRSKRTKRKAGRKRA